MTRGIGMPALIAIVAVVLVGGGAVYFNAQPEAEKKMEMGDEMMHEGEAMMEKGEKMMEKGDAMKKEGEAMMEKEGEAMMKDGEAMESGTMMHDDSYQGEVLAKNPDGAVLLDFNQADYEKAIADGKLVALFFYANWCPSCRIEFPKMQSAFEELPDGVVGFRVNYNDSQTDSYEKDLAREFGVGYQHTKVFVKNGERILKSPESWSKDRYVTEITNALK